LTALWGNWVNRGNSSRFSIDGSRQIEYLIDGLFASAVEVALSFLFSGRSAAPRATDS